MGNKHIWSVRFPFMKYFVIQGYVLSQLFTIFVYKGDNLHLSPHSVAAL